MMGAWGIGNFENDDASDWLLDLVERDGEEVEVLEAAFAAVNGAGYREAPDCANALAAAEVLAAVFGKPSSDLPEEAKPIVERFKGSATESLRRAGREAVDHVLVESELRELWEEGDDFESWTKIQVDLLERLGDL